MHVFENSSLEARSSAVLGRDGKFSSLKSKIFPERGKKKAASLGWRPDMFR